MLLAAGTVATVPLGGCGGFGDSRTDRPGADQFSLDAETTSGATAASPPQFRVTVTYEGTVPVTVEYGHDLMFRYAEHDAPGELVVVPSGGPVPAVPTRRTGGCWWYSPADGERTVVVLDSLTRETLRPGDELRETFSVFADRSAGECYPPGKYRFADSIGVRPDGPNRTVILEVVLEIDGNGTLAVRALEPRSAP